MRKIIAISMLYYLCAIRWVAIGDSQIGTYFYSLGGRKVGNYNTQCYVINVKLILKFEFKPNYYYYYFIN
jgi:hypothetical protein